MSCTFQNETSCAVCFANTMFVSLATNSCAGWVCRLVCRPGFASVFTIAQVELDRLFCSMPRRKANIVPRNGDAGHVSSSQRRMQATSAKPATGRTASMKVNDRKAEWEMITELQFRNKAELHRRSFGALGKNPGLRDALVDTMVSVSRKLRVCHCFRCAPIPYGDSKWAGLFQCPELNAATRIAWFLPQRLRNHFGSTAKGAFISYKMGLSQLGRICTVISIDGLRFYHMYRATRVMRLHDEAFDISNSPLFPRTIFGGIAQFLDFDEINTVSMTQAFMRCYIKSEMDQLLCFKIQDCSDMSDIFCRLKDLVNFYGRRYLPIATGNGLNLPGLCKYSNNTLAILAARDRIYKRDLESQPAAQRENPETHYRFILRKMAERQGLHVPGQSIWLVFPGWSLWTGLSLSVASLERVRERWCHSIIEGHILPAAGRIVSVMRLGCVH